MHDGRGIALFFIGILLFVAAMQLQDIPRIACLGATMIIYGRSRYVFGPTGKAMIIPALIFLLMIPLQQITWLEEMFFTSIKAASLWCWGSLTPELEHFFLCNDIYFVALLRDILTSLLLLFSITNMSVVSKLKIALFAISWSYFAAVCIYSLGFNYVEAFRDVNMGTAARCADWAMTLAILVYEILRRKFREKPVEIDTSTEATQEMI